MGVKHEKLSVVSVVVHFINAKYEAVTRLIGLPELLGHRKAGVGKSCSMLSKPIRERQRVLTDLFLDQVAVILPLLQHFGITNDNLGYFVLDNALNNDTTLVALAESMGFDPKQKRLRCMGHILNLIAESYIFGQDASTFDENFKKASPRERRKLWRQ